jgi:fructose transport system ATP-binding protein
MILISHYLRPVFDPVGRIVVFRRGRIVASVRNDETDGNNMLGCITGVKGGSDAAHAKSLLPIAPDTMRNHAHAPGRR